MDKHLNKVNKKMREPVKTPSKASSHKKNKVGVKFSTPVRIEDLNRGQAKTTSRLD